ncbi:MAG: hypothetical protein ABIZ72_10075 [Candidatus Limnocylindrales bacterium]
MVATDWAGYDAAVDGRQPRALFDRAVAARSGRAFNGPKLWHVLELVAGVPGGD